MAIKLLRKFLLIFFIFCFASGFLFSQEKIVNEIRFIQRFSWCGNEYTYRYEVIVEKLENRRYVPYFRDSTFSPFIEVSFPHGEYRFQIIPYDILDTPGSPSEWKNIQVRHALHPEPAQTSPEILRDYGGEPYGLSLNITGKNLDPHAEVFLLHPDNRRTPLDVLEDGAGGNLKVFIDSENLPPGEYDIIIRNPGGLEAKAGKTIIGDTIKQIAEIKEQRAEIREQTEKNKDQVTENKDQITDDKDQITDIRVEEVYVEEKTELALEPEPEPEPEPALTPAIRKYLFKMSASLGVMNANANESIGNFFVAGQMGIGFRLPYNIFIGPEITTSFSGFAWLGGVNVLTEIWSPSYRVGAGIRLGLSYPFTLFNLNYDTEHPFVNYDPYDPYYPNDYTYDIDSYKKPVIVNLGASVSLRIFRRSFVEIGFNYMFISGGLPGRFNIMAGLGLVY